MQHDPGAVLKPPETKDRRERTCHDLIPGEDTLPCLTQVSPQPDQMASHTAMSEHNSGSPEALSIKELPGAWTLFEYEGDAHRLLFAVMEPGWLSLG